MVLLAGGLGAGHDVPAPLSPSTPNSPTPESGG